MSDSRTTPQHSVSAETGARKQLSSSTEKARWVLYVGTDKVLSGVLSEALPARGYAFEAMLSIPDALFVAGRERVDLLIADLGLVQIGVDQLHSMWHMLNCCSKLVVITLWGHGIVGVEQRYRDGNTLVVRSVTVDNVLAMLTEGLQVPESTRV